MERVKAIIAEFKLDKRLWMELAETVVYLKNRSPTTAVTTTPYELWYSVKPDLSHLRIIGSTAYVHVPKEKRIKLDTHSHKGILIGYGGGTNQYKVWDLTRKDIVIARDVVFVEGKPIELTPTAFIEEPKIVHDSIMVLPGPAPEAETEEPKWLPTPPPTERSGTSPGENPEEQETEFVDPQILLQEATGGTQDGRIEGAPSVEPTHRTSGRSGRGTFTTKKFEEEDFSKKSGQTRMAKLARNIDPNY